MFIQLSRSSLGPTSFFWVTFTFCCVLDVFLYVLAMLSLSNLFSWCFSSYNFSDFVSRDKYIRGIAYLVSGMHLVGYEILYFYILYFLLSQVFFSHIVSCFGACERHVFLNPYFSLSVGLNSWFKKKCTFHLILFMRLSIFSINFGLYADNVL